MSNDQSRQGAQVARGSRAGVLALAGVMGLAAVAHAANQSVDEAAMHGAAASSQDTALGEIVVTAERRSESLLRVPIAVSALSGDDLAKEGITKLVNLASIVPNLQVNDSTGGSEPNFTLRGVGLGNDYSSNQASPVGVYVDDAYLAFRATHGAQMFDLERIEVLRGPQGTLYGRNTTGGAINFITRKPDLGASNGSLEVGYGNFQTVRAEGAAEVTPVAGVFGIRSAVSFERRDGFIENTFPGGTDLANGNNLRGRIAFRWKPSDQTDINLRVFGERTRQIQPGVFQLGALPGGVNPITGYGRGGLDFFSVMSDHPHQNEVRARGATLTMKFDLSSTLSLQSLTSYDTASSLFGQDVDGSPVNLLETIFDSKYSEINQELRLSYTGAAWRFQAGGFYGRDRITVANRYDLFGFLEQLGVPADPFLTTGGGTISQNYRQIRISKAVFGQADVPLGEKLNATLGARYTWDDAEYRDGTAFIGDYHYVPFVQTIGSPGAPLNRDGSNSALTGRVALTYTLQNDRMLYASYSRGYRAGTFNGSGYFSPAQISFVEPEKVNAYEIGAKGRFFDDALTLAAAAFYYDYTNQQLQDVVGPVAFLRNAGASTLKGSEVEGTVRIASNAVFSANVGYVDSRYDSLVLSGNDLHGNRLPFTPKITANARLDLTLHNVASGDLVLTPSLTYTGRQYFSPYNGLAGNGPMQQDSYTLVDANVEWKNGPWSLRIWGKNLADKGAFVYGNNFVSAFGYYYFNQNQPRTFGASIRRSF
jgi:iron complex outermembrane recepter protein